VGAIHSGFSARSIGAIIRVCPGAASPLVTSVIGPVPSTETPASRPYWYFASPAIVKNNRYVPGRDIFKLYLAIRSITHLDGRSPFPVES
jgi:hypothetical protein